MTACHRRIGDGAKPPLRRIRRGMATKGRGAAALRPYRLLAERGLGGVVCRAAAGRVTNGDNISV